MLSVIGRWIAIGSQSPDLPGEVRHFVIRQASPPVQGFDAFRGRAELRFIRRCKRDGREQRRRMVQLAQPKQIQGQLVSILLPLN